MPRVKTDWSVEGPKENERGQVRRAFVVQGSATGDVSVQVRDDLQKQFAGAGYDITVTVSNDTRAYFRHSDGQS